MKLLYLTADKVGQATGGGKVTFHEMDALKSVGEVVVLSREELSRHPSFDATQDPWCWDKVAVQLVQQMPAFDLAHVYAGTFTETLSLLKDRGTKITYTAAAHDVELSKKAHEDVGLPFDFPHLTDPHLWERYVGGYRLADVVVVPSSHSQRVMAKHGCYRARLIPHGCDETGLVAARPFPRQFTVGYLGAMGPDKGVRYLMQAWKDLSYVSACLWIGGRDSVSPFSSQLFTRYGGGNLRLLGWVDSLHDFYSGISCYVQPSVSEGFGIEVLEAMHYGRPVICSTGAGASDLVEGEWTYAYDNVERLCQLIDALRERHDKRKLAELAAPLILRASNFTWEKVKPLYVALWKEMSNDD